EAGFQRGARVEHAGLFLDLVNFLRRAEEARGEAREAVRHRERAEVQRVEADEGGGSVVLVAVEHVGAIGGERELEQAAGEAALRLDDREEAPRAEIEALQDAAHVEENLFAEPILAERPERGVVCTNERSVTSRAEEQEPDARMIEAELEQRS